MKITASTTLRELALVVCTALDAGGTTAILSGGGAATVYAPEALQSHDLDFIFSFRSALVSPDVSPLLNLGFAESGGMYRHPNTAFSVEFPPGPLAIGNEVITSWSTLREDDLLLHIIDPTDCVRDRLAWFLFNNDYSALEQALLVAARVPIDMARIEAWCKSEGEPGKFAIFKNRLER